MRWIYGALLYLLLPVVLARLLWKGRALPDYWRRVPERFGFVPEVPGGVAVWVHAVSVGESLAALPLIRRLAERHGPGRVLVTTTTPTGSARVRAALGERVRHTYAPYDLPDAVSRFLRRTAPRQVIVMETEIWPNLFHALGARGVPLAIANARLSPGSFAGYRRLRGFTRATLAHCRAIAAQSEADADRFRALGAPAERVHVMGNLKFDFEVPEDQVARGRALRERLGAGRPAWIAASTHEPEETLALNAHRILLKRFPDAVLILVPRHPQRFDAIAALVRESGLAGVRRSALESPDVPLAGAQVLLGDSMGELPAYLAAADVAFVGGSLAEIGGHNVLEPAALGLPVLFGPHMFNFEAARALLLQAGAARQVGSGLELAPAVTALLRDPGARAAMGRAARDTVRANRGALERLLALLDAAPGG